MSDSRPFVIATDSTSDLPLKYLEENDIPFISLTFNIDGADRKDDLGKTVDYKAFYARMREGSPATTAQITMNEFITFFEPMLQKGLDVIYIGFSSGLSGTFESSVMAQRELAPKYPQARLTVIDSRCASMGEGLLVYLAAEKKKAGASYDEVVKWAEENKLKLNHWFTVDDLHHLHRGGRVSATSAIIGTILKIKPILNVNNEGKLIPMEKSAGRKHALKRLVELMEENAVDPGSQTVFVSHGDSAEDAEYVANLVREKFGVKNIMINYIGPVIGSHSGPGTIALFFMGRQR